MQWLWVDLCCVSLDGLYNGGFRAPRDVEPRANRGLSHWPREWLTQAVGDSSPCCVHCQWSIACDGAREIAHTGRASLPL